MRLDEQLKVLQGAVKGERIFFRPDPLRPENWKLDAQFSIWKEFKYDYETEFDFYHDDYMLYKDFKKMREKEKKEHEKEIEDEDDDEDDEDDDSVPIWARGL